MQDDMPARSYHANVCYFFCYSP